MEANTKHPDSTVKLLFEAKQSTTSCCCCCGESNSSWCFVLHSMHTHTHCRYIYCTSVSVSVCGMCAGCVHVHMQFGRPYTNAHSINTEHKTHSIEWMNDALKQSQLKKNWSCLVLGWPQPLKLRWLDLERWPVTGHITTECSCVMPRRPQLN